MKWNKGSRWEPFQLSASHFRSCLKTHKHVKLFSLGFVSKQHFLSSWLRQVPPGMLLQSSPTLAPFNQLPKWLQDPPPWKPFPQLCIFLPVKLAEALPPYLCSTSLHLGCWPQLLQHITQALPGLSVKTLQHTQNWVSICTRSWNSLSSRIFWLHWFLLCLFLFSATSS